MSDRKSAPNPLSDLTCAISERAGVCITGERSNQKGWSIQHGYARLEFSKGVRDFLEMGTARAPLTVTGRKEGDENPGFPHLTRDFILTPGVDGWYERLVDWAADILKTGRTLECGKGIGLDELRKDSPRGFQICDHPMNGVQRLFHPEEDPKFDLNLDPDYQRDHVWTDQQASSFVGFTLKTEGPNTPLIFIQRDDSGLDEVIDGKQRLTAFRRWVRGEIPATVDDREVWYRDTNEVDRRMFPNIKLAYVTLTKRQRLAFYLALNAGGTIHTSTEINKVRAMLAKLPEEEQ